jgi:hypothetical protein
MFERRRRSIKARSDAASAPAVRFQSRRRLPPDGERVVEHVAGVEDYELALATFRAACERWLGTPVTLRQGARVIEDSRRLRLAWSDKGRPGGR